MKALVSILHGGVTIRHGDQTDCLADGEAVGRYVSIEIAGLILTLTLTRRERRS